MSVRARYSVSTETITKFGVKRITFGAKRASTIRTDVISWLERIHVETLKT